MFVQTMGMALLAYLTVAVMFYSLATASAAPDPYSEKRRKRFAWWL